jgi:hypothetical protein
MAQLRNEIYDENGLVRNEIYDENGLVRIEFTEVESPTQEELIQEKEAQLLALYEELKSLRGE